MRILVTIIVYFHFFLDLIELKITFLIQNFELSSIYDKTLYSR